MIFQVNFLLLPTLYFGAQMLTILPRNPCLVGIAIDYRFFKRLPVPSMLPAK
jgi:hypothetical protein